MRWVLIERCRKTPSAVATEGVFFGLKKDEQ
jgi:hypothetical protein